MDKDMKDAAMFVLALCVGFSLLALAITFGLSQSWKQDTTYPVACADIPESNQRVIIVRDGQVECHYEITRVKEKKK